MKEKYTDLKNLSFKKAKEYAILIYALLKKFPIE